MTDNIVSVLSDIDCCAVDVDRVKDALAVFLERAQGDLAYLKAVDNEAVRTYEARYAESVAILDLAEIVLRPTVDLLTSSSNRLFELCGQMIREQAASQ